jgi:hypothetical protein
MPSFGSLLMAPARPRTNSAASISFVSDEGVAASLASGSALLAQEFDGHAHTRAFSLPGTSFGLGSWLFGAPTAVVPIGYPGGWRSIFRIIAAIGTPALILVMAAQWQRLFR